METKPAVVDHQQVVSTSISDVPNPSVVVSQGIDIANLLKDIIDKKGLYADIGKKKYVTVEGWTTMGAMLGILPRESQVREHKDGSFEARVELVRARDGQVVGGASALCGSDEQAWRSRERYARRSMAITRATSKAYRIAYGWIMSIAGYEVTPAEEVPQEGFSRPTKPVTPKQIARPQLPKSKPKSAPRTAEIATQDDVLGYVVKFGKHKGKTIQELGRQAARYAAWLSDNAKTTGKPLSTDAQEFLEKATVYEEKYMPRKEETPPPVSQQDLRGPDEVLDEIPF